jgi:hypothetical protein
MYMDLLLLLTVIGFIISIFQIAEEYKKRNLIFKLIWWDKLLLFVFVLSLILTIIFQNLFSIQETQPILTATLFENPLIIPYSFILSLCAFALAIAIIVYFLMKLNSKKIANKNKFIKNLFDSLNKQNFTTLSADLELFHDDLLKKYKIPEKWRLYFLKYICYLFSKLSNIFRKHGARVKLHKKIRLLMKSIESYTDFKKNLISSKDSFELLPSNRKELFCDNVVGIINNLRQGYKMQTKYALLVDNLYYEISNDDDFLKFVASKNTNLMFKLMKNKLLYSKEDVWSVMGRKLISDTGSRLCKELRPKYQGKKRILEFLFNDVSKSAEWNVWRPIGNTVLDYIHNQRKKNIDVENYSENNHGYLKNYSPIYLGHNFFRIMVNHALEQNVGDHMWLYYFQYWIEEIIDNIQYENNDPAEFKNLYERYIYQFFETYRDWITYVVHSNYNIREDTGSADIIEAAINSFTFAMETVAESTIVRDDFKVYLREIYLDTYMKIATSNPRERLESYKVFFDSCLSGDGNHGRTRPTFILFLQDAVNNPSNRHKWEGGLHWNINNNDELESFQHLLRSL